MAKVRTAASLSDPMQAQLRGQLLDVFKQSRALGESSAQLRQRLVGAVFGTIQGQIDQARAERFAESEASVARKQARASAGIGAAIGAAGGAALSAPLLDAGGGAAGAAGGAGTAVANAPLALPAASAGAGSGLGPGVANALFAQNVLTGASIGSNLGAGQPISPTVANVPGGQASFLQGVFERGQQAANETSTLKQAVGNQAASAVSTPATATANAPALVPGIAVSPTVTGQVAANAIAQIAGLNDDQVLAVWQDALNANDTEAAELFLLEAQRRGLIQ